MTLPDPRQTAAFSEQYWEGDALEALSDYVRIPCLSPDFDPDWHEHGAIDEAGRMLADFCRRRGLSTATAELVELAGRTPVVVAEIGASDASAPSTLFYGHFDKQPPLGEWGEGLGAFDPVRRGDRLFGRGSCDDGYALLAALGAVEALEQAGTPHGRVLILAEASEESSSVDLDPYLDALAGRIGEPALVVCLDTGGPSYDRLWTATSLRGLVDGVLRVDVLTEGIHSGLAGGIVPSPFRILRSLLGRVEDEESGDVVLEACRAALPGERRAEIDAAASAAGEDFPVLAGVELDGEGAADRLERGTWRASMEVVGVEGLPPLESAGNLMRPWAAVKVSLRLAPTTDASAAAAALERALVSDPPRRARVSFAAGHAASGWNAPERAPWLEEALEEASQRYFDNSEMGLGLGGSIPFMGSLSRRYPGAQFVATGVLGPGSNAHSTEENLHLPTVKAVTSSAAHLLGSLATLASTD